MIAQDERLDHLLQAQGVVSVPIPITKHLQGVALDLDLVQIGAFNMDWGRWFYQNEQLGKRPFFEQITETLSYEEDRSQRALLLKSEDPQQASLTYLTQVVADIMHLTVEKINPETSLSLFGIDSLMAAEILTRVKGDLGISIPAVFFLQGDSLKDVMVWLVNALHEDNSTGVDHAAIVDPQIVQIESVINQFQDNEIEALVSKLPPRSDQTPRDYLQTYIHTHANSLDLQYPVSFWQRIIWSLLELAPEKIHPIGRHIWYEQPVQQMVQAYAPIHRQLPHAELTIMQLGPMQTNCYILRCLQTDKVAVIDPGWEGTFIVEYLRQNQLEPTHILLTHAHFDHIGGLFELKQAFPNATLYAHEQSGNIAQQALLWAREKGWEIPAAPIVDQILADGATLFVGNLCLEARYTPGHSPDHLSFYLPEEDALFGGDVLFRNEIGPATLQHSDETLLLQTVQQKILTLPKQTRLFAGHGPETSIGNELQFNKQLQELVVA